MPLPCHTSGCTSHAAAAHCLPPHPTSVLSKHLSSQITVTSTHGSCTLNSLSAQQTAAPRGRPCSYDERVHTYSHISTRINTASKQPSTRIISPSDSGHCGMCPPTLSQSKYMPRCSTVAPARQPTNWTSSGFRLPAAVVVAVALPPVAPRRSWRSATSQASLRVGGARWCIQPDRAHSVRGVIPQLA